jgi:drug/metabolite transporter (DMT)-like permease
MSGGATESEGLPNPVRGALCGLAAAALFGLSTPFVKLLVPGTHPLALASLLYLGAPVA